MGRAMLLICLPWFGLLVLGVGAAALLVWLSGARWQAVRLGQLHRDQTGAVQSLSFVLTLPLFILVMLFIIQVSQLMIAAAVVQYAAFAAARAAIVWIPANLGPEEQANCFGNLCLIDRSAPDTVEPVWDLASGAFGPRNGGLTYVVQPGSPKYQKIWAAAVLACMPICPSSPNLVTVGGMSGANGSARLPGNGAAIASVLEQAYRAMVPASRSNVSARIQNKLAYAMANTQIEVRFFHPNSEVPLQDYSKWAPWGIDPGKPREVVDARGEPLGFKAPSDPTVGTMELGWRDPITVTVFHQFALLPGPGRFLSRPNPKVPTDTVDQRIRLQDGIYKYLLWASATLGNEGEKSVIPYWETE